MASDVSPLVRKALIEELEQLRSAVQELAAPLSDQARGGMDAYLFSFALIGISLALVGLNMIATVMTMRAPGLTYNRIPVFVWGVITTSVLAVLAAPVLFAALYMGAFDRTIETSRAGSSPSTRATASVPAASSDSIPVREMKVTP